MLRSLSPKVYPSQPSGVNGLSANVTAASVFRPAAGVPNRCSEWMEKLSGLSKAASSGADVNSTRICGGANSSTRTVREPSVLPFSPGVLRRNAQMPEGWSSGTDSGASGLMAPAESGIRVKERKTRPSGLTISRTTGNGAGALALPSRSSACMWMGSRCR